MIKTFGGIAVVLSMWYVICGYCVCVKGGGGVFRDTMYGMHTVQPSFENHRRRGGKKGPLDASDGNQRGKNADRMQQ